VERGIPELLLSCVNREKLIVAGRFASLLTWRVANERAVIGKRAVTRTRSLRACLAVTGFAILFASRPLSKNHGCCPDAAGFNAPKSWAGVFHGAVLHLNTLFAAKFYAFESSDP
jgi:hypothetical protein